MVDNKTHSNIKTWYEMLLIVCTCSVFSVPHLSPAAGHCKVCTHCKIHHTCMSVISLWQTKEN